MEKLNSRMPLPLLVLGFLALLAAMWAGLIRLGWNLPTPQPILPISHGPLMISGFLGTVIGIERAVALSALPASGSMYRWAYLGPLLTGLGAVSLIIGVSGLAGPLLISLGSLSLVLVFAFILRIQLASFTIIMTGGAVLWLVGNGLWLLGWPVYSVVGWWSGFLILTIAGERLELNRVRRLSRPVQMILLFAIGLLLAGLAIFWFRFDFGVRLAGAGMLAIALWLLRYDIARHTIKKSGLSRFMAICLLSGYGWLAIGGGLAIRYGGVSAGFHYDAMQHAIFVGFVISMIFGHAPIIFPAVTGKPIPFQSIFYSHLVLLHLSLLLRTVGDLTFWLPGRQWGGLLNVVALLLFLINTVRAMRSARSTPTTSTVPQWGQPG